MIATLTLAIALLTQSDDPVGAERAEFVKLAETSAARLDPTLKLGELMFVKARGLRSGSAWVEVSYGDFGLTFDRQSKRWIGYGDISRIHEPRPKTPPPTPTVPQMMTWVEKARLTMGHPLPYVICDYYIPAAVHSEPDATDVPQGPYEFYVSVQPIRDGIRYLDSRFATFYADPPGQLTGFSVSSVDPQEPDSKQERKLTTEQAEVLALETAKKTVPQFASKTFRRTREPRLEYINQKSGKARLAWFFAYRYEPAQISGDGNNYLVWIDTETGAVLHENHVFEPPEGIGDPSYKPN